MRRSSLRLRLFVSYALVAVVGALVMAGVAEVVGRSLFDHHMTGLGFRAGGHAGTGLAELRSAFGSALTQSLLVAVAASLVAAGVAAVVVARRILRPLDDIRAAAHHLAAGDYGRVLPEPKEPELAGLVRDVNFLAVSLKLVEQRRAALIGDVAHEMRTPITALKGYTDGLADGVFDGGEVLPAVGAELTRLERLAADLAAVSRWEEGGLTIQRHEDDLSAVVVAVTDRLMPQYLEQGVELSVRSEGPIPVSVDRERIIQALTNVIGNALTYTPPGGKVTVTVRRRPDDGAEVDVTDTGIGIDPRDLPRIFERFYRVDALGHARGSGIGLTIARAIARAHGGDLTATSAGGGKGSTFVLVLPTGELSSCSASGGH